MQFKVPSNKDSEFAMKLFSLLSDSLTDLKLEHGKWPDRVIFSGPLGKEVHSFIVEKGWDLEKFNLSVLNGIVNKLIIEYSKPLNQIEDRGGTIFDEPLHNKTIQGIPGPETSQKILSAYSNMNFIIERSVRPKIEIKLLR